MDIFLEVLKKMGKHFGKGNSFSITFTKDMLAPNDNWLLQVACYGKEERLTFKRNDWGVIMVCFKDICENIHLEEVPKTFLNTLYKNL